VSAVPDIRIQGQHQLSSFSIQLQKHGQTVNVCTNQ